MLTAIKNTAWALLFIAFVIFCGWLWEWIMPTGSANVVDMYGCVLPQYYKDRVQIENIMRMRGYTDEEIIYAFDCH